MWLPGHSILFITAFKVLLKTEKRIFERVLIYVYRVRGYFYLRGAML